MSKFATRAKAAWARLIRKVYEADPLECPKCRSVKSGPMRVIALSFKIVATPCQSWPGLVLVNRSGRLPGFSGKVLQQRVRYTFFRNGELMPPHRRRQGFVP